MVESATVRVSNAEAFIRRLDMTGGFHVLARLLVPHYQPHHDDLSGEDEL